MKHVLTVAILVLALASMLTPASAQPFVDGIDVSRHQGSINWTSVVNSGVEFAFMKATEGVDFVDERFHQNIVGATVAGVLVGPYHYGRPDSSMTNPLDPVNEANDFLAEIEPYYDAGLYLPPVLDVEEFDLGLSISQTRTFISNWVQDFSDTVQSALGVRPIIYTGKSAANTYFTPSVASQHDLWMAWWKGTGTTDPPVQSDAPDWNLWEFWQYSATGSVPGISGNVDLDVYNGTRQELETMLIGYDPEPSDDPVNITDFENDEGYFGWPPLFSGSNQGIGPGTTAERVTTEAQDGAASQQLFIEGDEGGWFWRHVSGIGSAASPDGNLPLEATGHVGFWLKTDDSGVSVQLALDAPDTADRGLAKEVIADGNWHLYEWNLDDDDEWEAWVNGDGVIDEPTVTIDSIQFSGVGNATLYLDSVSHNPLGSLLPNSGIDGDFNNDGLVNIADYTVWRDNQGAPDATISANGDDIGTVDAGDYAVWKSAFGTASATIAGAAPIEAAQVPEPATVWLVGMLVAGFSRIARASRAKVH